MVAKQSIIVAAPGQVSADLAGEVVILNLRNGVYYGLDEVGALIWKLIQQPRTLAEIRDAILEEYEVDPERCERDLLTLLQKLVAAELVEIKDAVAV